MTENGPDRPMPSSAEFDMAVGYVDMPHSGDADGDDDDGGGGDGDDDSD